MKLKYIFTSLVAVCALAIGCTKSYPTELDNFKVSQSTVGLKADKIDSVLVTINASEKWEFVKQQWIEGTDTTVAAHPKWMSIDKIAGDAGEYTIKIKSTGTTNACNKATLKVQCGKSVQYLYVQQGVPEVKEVTCAEIIAGADGATYKVTGTVKSISDAEVYGNWYIMDETGEVYVYGTKDANGESKKGALVSYGISVGDIVTIEGPKTTYKGTVELVDVTIIKIVKSLIEVCNKDDLTGISKEGADVDMKVIVKGDDLKIKTAINDSTLTELDWLSVRSIDTKKAVKSSDPDTTIVKVRVDANADDVRSGIVSFTSGTSTIAVSVSQKSGLPAYPLPYEEKFDTGIGAWTINDVKIAEGKTFVWTYNSSGYMKASAGVKKDSESWLVSPAINLSSATAAHLSFDHIQRYPDNLYAELTLWVSVDRGTTWTQLAVPYWSTGKDWNFVNSGNISLNAYVGNQVMIAFKYVSNTNAYATWEIKNVKVDEGDGTMTSVAEMTSLAYDNKVKTNFSGTLTNALVTYVNGNNVFIEDATGGMLLYKSEHGFEVGDQISGSVTGTMNYYGGFAEAIDLDATSATVTKGQTVTPKELTIDALKAAFIRYISCNVVLKGISINPALGSNRSTTVTQGTSTIPGYAKVKNVVTIDADKNGDLRCYPCLNGGPTTAQVGIWEASHFTSEPE